MAKSNKVSIFVTFRNLIFVPSKGGHVKAPSKTTYLSVEVVIPKTLLTKKNWNAIIQHGEEAFFNCSPMKDVSSHQFGMNHRHRSIDEMRIHHLVLGRKMIHEQGGTAPGSPAHVSIWM